MLDYVVQLTALLVITSSFSSLQLTISTELKPLIILFYISEINVLLLEQGPYTRIALLMKTVYKFNSSNCRCMIVLKFDGTYRTELLNIFEAETYMQILQALVKKAAISNLIQNKDLQIFSSPDSDISIITKWMNGIGDLIRKYYKKYTEALFDLNFYQMLYVIAFALLGSEFKDTSKTLVLSSIYTWEMLEKYGTISLYSPRRSLVKMLYILLQTSHTSAKMKNVMLQSLYFSSFSGIAACTYVNLPDAIQNIDHLDHWPKILIHYFDSQKDLEKGAYIGIGNDEFADSWVVFRREVKKGVIVLTIESKHYATTERLTAEYFNAHKKKVKKKLPKGTLYIFVIVADMCGENVTADNDKMIICKENMKEMYGNWLVQYCHFSLVFDKRTK
ncbi:3519_t:CDS:2 [Funneliformis mosseae]|uniref:3519_t:CDS:1 n=1 Tax=Funneliformis mosseae TaxID=27381 RepID=A0A9N9DQY6_FUNMO|nr:3519_t:CDS:2 [Funneliformis mosseae]